MANKVANANSTFNENIQRALSTLTRSQWKVLNHEKAGEAIRLYTLLPSLALKDSTGVELYELSAFIVTEVTSDSSLSGKRVTTRQYIYKIASRADGKPLYEFHWHPQKIDRHTLEPAKPGQSEKLPIPYPHVHVRARDKRFMDLNKRHIPSGRVAFEDVAEFLIGDCGIKPNRQDWQAVLAATRKIFQNSSNWR
jgi:hypothetical protein